MQGNKKNIETNRPDDTNRRRAIKKIAVGVGVLAGYSVLPEQWTRPVIGQITLPVHAATSGVTLSSSSCTATLVSGDQSTAEVTVEVTGSVSPATENMSAEIVADGAESVVAMTDADGTYTGDLTVTGGPGLTEISVQVTVSGAEGTASCTVAVPAEAETKTPTDPTETEEYNSKETYSLNSLAGNNKRFTWLNHTGSYYGGKIKFVFSSCGDLVVPDAAVSHGADGTTGNKNQAFYFCGTDYKPGDAEYNNKLASVFGPPGCSAATVTLYFNK